MFNKDFFLKHQRLLLLFANTQYGKSLLGHGLDKVDLILPNAVFQKNEKDITAEFRGHDKYSKRLFYEFQPIWKAFHWFDINVANIYVPKLNLGFDTLGPIYPVAGANSPVDGYVARNAVNEIFSTIRAGAGTTSNVTGSSDVGMAQITSTATSNQYGDFSRGIFCWDTSSLSGGTVLTTIVSIANDRKLNGNGDTGLEFDLVAATPAATNALANSDYGQLGTTVFASVSYASVTAEAYSDFTCDANGIANVSTSDITKFGLRMNWDTDNSFGGTWASGATTGFYGYMADNTGTTYDPKLVVTYTPSSGFFAIL